MAEDAITCGECRYHIRTENYHTIGYGYCDSFCHNETFRNHTGLSKFVIFSSEHKCVYGVRE